MLADLLEGLVERYVPASVAIIGCAGGNGLDRACVQRLARVVAVDINPQYLQETGRRYSTRVPGLELHCVDVQTDQLRFEPVELVYAALLFEHVDVASTMKTLWRGCRSGGVLAAVLQAPHEGQSPVSASPYRSLQMLASTMKLVAPGSLRAYATAVGFSLDAENAYQLPTGKTFSVLIFRA
jgi:hypothetical protein